MSRKIIHFRLFNLVSALLPSRMSGLRGALARFSGFDIHRNSTLCTGVILAGSNITIKQNTWLSPEVRIYANSSGPVLIGEHCDISHGVRIVTGGHDIGSGQRRAGQCVSRPTVIGDGSWIGAYSLILGGVSIGKGTIVGAGSVVLPGDYPT